MKKHSFTQLFAGIILLSALMYAVTHFGEFARFVILVRSIEPSWLFLALLLQSGTYFMPAMVWFRTLRSEGIRYQLRQLVPLAVAKLFTDKAIPSGGISGIAFVFTALRQRKISAEVCMRVMLIDILSYYTAYLLVATGALLVLWLHHDIRKWMVVVGAMFVAVALFIPAAVLFLKQLGTNDRLPAWIVRIPRVASILDIWSGVPQSKGQKPKLNPLLFIEATIYQTTVFILDSATLWAMLQALGEPVSLVLAFPCLVFASMVAMLSPIPLGLGTFEAACVGLLIMFKVRVETALTATLLLRGFTLWLPMLPGLIVTRMKR
ncbi:MAG: flippase-like domain-containing protein [Chlorobiaceae bacterium]|nr:flippase-like domain-containing protein [Chlorobiaceae bacterium]NTW74911.1 flippase-like domain-containing protein [Chlorobiaceae bacterium]